MRLGACGYLSKESTSSELVDAIRKVSAGGKYITRALAEQLADEAGAQAEKPSYETLSDREFQVLTRLGNGKSTSQIAEELKISPKTVSTYRSRILEKLNLNSTADIIRYVIEYHLGD